MLKRSTVVKQVRPALRVVPVALVVVAVLAFAVLLWEEGLKDRATYKNLAQVEPGLWRSGQISAHAIGPALRRVGPDLIISLSPDNLANPANHNAAEARAARVAGVRREHVDLRGDGTGDPREYVDALTLIADARARGDTVLVHCWAGSERTGGVVALWRVLFRGEKPAVAVREMSDHGHDVEEGPLIDYLNRHLPDIAAALVERGVLDRLPDPPPEFPRTAD